MPNISLASYGIRVSRKYRPDEFEALRAIGDDGVDFLDLLEDILRPLGATPENQEDSLFVLRIRELHRDGDAVYGQILAGNYGYTAALVDVETAETTYDRRMQDAELVPMFFYFRCPADSDVGVAIFERFGGLGIKTQLGRVVETRFRERLQDHVFRLTPLLPREVLQELLEGELQAIQMVTFKVPEDVADSVRVGHFDQLEAYLVQEIRATRGRFLPKPQWVRDLVAGRIRLAEVHDAVPEGVDVLKVKVNYGGNTRTVDFTRLEHLSPYIDVSQEVDIAGGHPVPASILRSAEEIATEVLERMGFED